MSLIKLIDIGANLTDRMFHGFYNGHHVHADDFAAMLQRSTAAGVERILVTAGHLEEAREALALVANHETLFTTVGVHPTRAGKFDQSGNPEKYFSDLLTLVQNNRQKVVAIGECGLDYDRLHFCNKPTQKKYFERQFELAEITKLPMFLHSRNTGNDFVDMVTANRSRFQHGVVHSFTGDWAEAESLLGMGLYIGINGCSLKTQENLQVMAKIPLNRLMLETDAPWCSIKATHASYAFVRTHFPSKKRERFEAGFTVKDRCEPCHMKQVLEVVASVRGIPETELAQAVYENTKSVFFPNL